MSESTDDFVSLFVVEEKIRTMLRVAIGVAQFAVFADADVRDAGAELPDLCECREWYCRKLGRYGEQLEYLIKRKKHIYKHILTGWFLLLNTCARP